MQYSLLLPVLSLLAPAEAAETILGVYMFHRHGDRTPKALAPANLTSLGYDQVYSSGQYYRSRYLTGSNKVKGLNTDLVKLSQLSITAPVDNVLQSSALGFSQGLYPPVGSSVGVQTLANGTNTTNPLNGYQIIPINIATSGSGSEDSTWLQASTGCGNAQVSSNNYFTSSQYTGLLASTKDFYSNIAPVVNGTFSSSQVNFKNAYTIFDLINVAQIHNSSIPDSQVLTNDTTLQIRTLADTHEWGLAYNATDNARAIAGMQLAGEVLQYLNSTITSGQAGSSSNRFGVQFGAYATFMSFFGLSNLTAANPDFYGVCDYASSLVFELFTTADTSSGFPATSDLQVRALFHNGTASNASEPQVYPLFGQSNDAVSWADFQSGLNKFAVSTTQEWCTACGNTTGSCAAYASSSNGGSNNGTTSHSSGGSHMSAAIGGVIGAFVTLAVVLGTLAAVMLLGGFRLVSKKRLGAGAGVPTQNAGTKA